MRIVAGRFRGRALAPPPDERTRPTSDRVRGAVFNVLTHGIEGFDIEGVFVLDLFAGTGALGLEAMSRGARYCLFVEDDPEARAVIRQNVEAFALTGHSRIWRRDATTLGDGTFKDKFSLVFLDPPYGKGLGEKALASARDGGWLADGAVIVLEEQAEQPIQWPDGFNVVDTRSWGGTAVHFARYAGSSA